MTFSFHFLLYISLVDFFRFDEIEKQPRTGRNSPEKTENHRVLKLNRSRRRQP